MNDPLHKYLDAFSTYIHLERFSQSLTDLLVKCKVAKCNVKLSRHGHLCVFLDSCLWFCRTMKENIKMKTKGKQMDKEIKTCFTE